MIKGLVKLRIKGMYLNITKAINDKPIANTILNGKRPKPFPLKSETRQGCTLSTFIQPCLGIPS
jgi:hypothetical protein